MIISCQSHPDVAPANMRPTHADAGGRTALPKQARGAREAGVVSDGALLSVRSLAQFYMQGCVCVPALKVGTKQLTEWL